MSRLSTLAHYRDRTINVITEIRAIVCVTDECKDQVSSSGRHEIEVEAAEAVDRLAAVLSYLQSAVERAVPCPHEEITSIRPGGLYRCDDCKSQLVNMRCEVCSRAVFPDQMTEHLALRCWADDSPLVTDRAPEGGS